MVAPGGFRELPISIEKLAAMYGLKDAHVRVEGGTLVLVGRPK